MLAAAGDPDREFLRQAEDGLPVGILDPLPRTPHVFQKQLKWPAPWEASLAWVPNYGSVEEHREFAKAKFEEDVGEGLMAKMSLGSFLDHITASTPLSPPWPLLSRTKLKIRSALSTTLRTGSGSTTGSSAATS